MNEAPRDRAALLADRLRAIAREIATWPAVSTNASGSEQPAPVLMRVRRELTVRRKRDGLFPPRLFAEPCWDMLLDLYVAADEGRQISISSACIASAVPPTTALRHIKVLEEAKLVARRADPQDGRRVHIELLPRGADLIAQVYSSDRSSGHATLPWSEG